MFRLTLRKKLLLFAIAIVPLLIAGRAMIRITEDELKSSVNEQLVTTAEELAHEIDTLFERTWLALLLLIRNAIDDEGLGVEEKIALLKAGVADSADIVALQVTVEGSRVPLLVKRDDFVARLKAAYLDPLHVLRVPGALISRSEGDLIGRDVTYLKETGSWLATVTLPLSETAMGAEATLLARIDLRRLRNHVEEHRFNQTGSITIVDRFARRIFDPEQPDLRRYQMVGEAMGLLASGARVVRTARYAGPDGRVLLGAYAFPRAVKWAVLVEKDKADA